MPAAEQVAQPECNTQEEEYDGENDPDGVNTDIEGHDDEEEVDLETADGDEEDMDDELGD